MKNFLVYALVVIAVQSGFAQLDPSSVRKYELRKIGQHDDECLGVFINKDNTVMATCSMDETIKLWDLGTLKEKFTLRGHRGSVYNISFNRDDRMIASGSADRTVRIWDAQSGTPVKTLRGHRAEVVGVYFSNDNNQLAST